MKNAIKGISGFLLIICGLSMLTQGTMLHYLVAFIWIFAGILCFPPVFPAIDDMIGARLKEPVKYALIVLLFIIGAIVVTNIPKQATVASTNSTTGTTSAPPANAATADDDHTFTVVFILFSVAAGAFYMAFYLARRNKQRAEEFARTMAETQRQGASQQQTTPVYTAPEIRLVTTELSTADEIKKLSDLYDLGQISAEEFARQKARLLG